MKRKPSSCGGKALEAISHAPRFNRWMFEEIKPHIIGHQIAELGCGIGNITKLLAKEAVAVLAIDIDLDALPKVWDIPKVEPCWGDLDTEFPYKKITRFAPTTIICLNVLEHLRHDELAVRRMVAALQPGGSLILLAPRSMSLYGETDRELGHFRRYERGQLATMLATDGLHDIQETTFNSPAVPAWWISRNKSCSAAISPWKMRVYDALTPVFRVINPVLPWDGISIIASGRKEK